MSSPRRRIAARRRSQPAGSPIEGEPVFVLIGILRKPHGLRGEAIVSVETDFPERLVKGTRLFLGENHLPLTLRSKRVSSEGLLLAFDELNGREALEPYRNESLFVKTSDIPLLASGHYYHHQLIGLDVYTEQGELLGKIVHVMDTTANDVYIVKRADHGEILLPATTEVVRQIDLHNKKMIVKLLPGLIA